MSTGTRKKKLDYKKMWTNDVENDATSDDQIKITKNKNQKKLINFLGKKRKLLGNTVDKNDKDRKGQKIKDMKSSEKWTREDYNLILANYSDELKAINIKPPSEEDNNSTFQAPSSLVWDMNKLYYNWFLSTKFENSKPYKMIDYIILNGDNLWNRATDKTKFDEMKKPIFMKPKPDTTINQNIVFASLYEYFKTDFSKSYLSKWIVKVNNNIQKQNKVQIENSLKNDISIPIEAAIKDKDKKDKFTYSNIISEKLNQSKASIMSYTSDCDFFKGWIYLNNKFNASWNKKAKIEKSLFTTLSANYERITKWESNGLGMKPGSEEDIYLNNLKRSKMIKTHMKKYFSDFINCISEIKKMKVNASGILELIIDFMTKAKEDEFDKIVNGVNEKLNKLNINIIWTQNQIRNIWITIRLLFFLIHFNRRNALQNKHYNTINSNIFWEEIFKYAKLIHSKLNKLETFEKEKSECGNKKDVNCKEEGKVNKIEFKAPKAPKRRKRGGVNVNNNNNNNNNSSCFSVDGNSSNILSGNDQSNSYHNPMSNENESGVDNKEIKNQEEVWSITEDIKTKILEQYLKGNNIFTVIKEGADNSTNKKKKFNKLTKENDGQSLLEKMKKENTKIKMKMDLDLNDDGKGGKAQEQKEKDNCETESENDDIKNNMLNVKNNSASKEGEETKEKCEGFHSFSQSNTKNEAERIFYVDKSYHGDKANHANSLHIKEIVTTTKVKKIREVRKKPKESKGDKDKEEKEDNKVNKVDEGEGYQVHSKGSAEKDNKDESEDKAQKEDKLNKDKIKNNKREKYKREKTVRKPKKRKQNPRNKRRRKWKRLNQPSN